VSGPSRRNFARVRAHLHRGERPSAIDHAVNAVRADIPPPPASLDERVLGPIRADCAAHTRHVRGRRIRRTGLWMMIAASMALVLLVIKPALPPPAPEGEQALASVPLTSDCGTTAEPARVRSGRRESGSTRERLVVAGPWGDSEADAFETVLKRFSEKTGIPVLYAYRTREIDKVLRHRLTRFCAPDVALLPQPGLLRELAAEGHLEQIDPATRRLVMHNQGSFWRKEGSVKEDLYGVWFKAANKSTLWYSRRLMDSVGAGAPATWSQLQRTATKLHDNDIAPFSVAGADGWTLTDWFENIYLRSAGKERYDDLTDHRIPWTHQTVRGALRRMSEMLRRDRLPGGRRAALMKTKFEASVDQVFATRPAAAMVYEGDFVASQIDAEHADDAGVVPFPAIAGSEPSVVVGGDVAALMTPNPDGQRLVRFLASVEAARLWARSGGISPNRRLEPEAYRDATTRGLAEALVKTEIKRFDLSDLQPPAFGTSADQGMRKILKDLLRGDIDVDGAARQLEAAADRSR